MPGLNVGDSIPLFNQLATYDATKYVRAYVQDPSGNPISGSPFNLSADGANGLYKNVSGVMPNVPWILAQYLVFSDSGYTTLDWANGGNSEVFTRNLSLSAIYYPPTSNIVAFVEDQGCSPGGPIQDTIVQGAARSLTVRLEAEVNGYAFNLTGATEIEFRMRNTDGSVLSLTLSDEEIEILNAGGGQFVVAVTAVQSAALAAAIPAPATVKVIIDGQVTVVNMPFQLAVVEPEI